MNITRVPKQVQILNLHLRVLQQKDYSRSEKREKKGRDNHLSSVHSCPPSCLKPKPYPQPTNSNAECISARQPASSAGIVLGEGTPYLNIAKLSPPVH